MSQPHQLDFLFGYHCSAAIWLANFGAHHRLSWPAATEIFAVDLILLFSRVRATTVKLKTNPHTNTSPITGNHLSPYTWKPLIMLSVVRASMLIGRATAVYYVRVSWVRRFTKLKFYFPVFGANPRNIVPTKISVHNVRSIGVGMRCPIHYISARLTLATLYSTLKLSIG